VFQRKNAGDKYGRETLDEKYRVYLLKFIDFLVTREVTINARVGCVNDFVDSFFRAESNQM